MSTTYQNSSYLHLANILAREEEEMQDTRLKASTDVDLAWQEPRAPVRIAASLEEIDELLLQRVAVILHTAKQRTHNGMADERTIQQEALAAKIYQDIHQRLQMKAKLMARKSTLSTKGIPQHFFRGKLI